LQQVKAKIDTCEKERSDKKEQSVTRSRLQHMLHAFKTKHSVLVALIQAQEEEQKSERHERIVEVGLKLEKDNPAGGHLANIATALGKKSVKEMLILAQHYDAQRQMDFKRSVQEAEIGASLSQQRAPSIKADEKAGAWGCKEEPPHQHQRSPQAAVEEPRHKHFIAAWLAHDKALTVHVLEREQEERRKRRGVEKSTTSAKKIGEQGYVVQKGELRGELQVAAEHRQRHVLPSSAIDCAGAAGAGAGNERTGEDTNDVNSTACRTLGTKERSMTRVASAANATTPSAANATTPPTQTLQTLNDKRLRGVGCQHGEEQERQTLREEQEHQTLLAICYKRGIAEQGKEYAESRLLHLRTAVCALGRSNMLQTPVYEQTALYEHLDKFKVKHEEDLNRHSRDLARAKYDHFRKKKRTLDT
jgi:hypothetical protein